jgi:hypothetical protein
VLNPSRHSTHQSSEASSPSPNYSISFSVAVSKLIKMIKHGLPFHRNSGAIKLTRFVFPRTQSSLFRSAAQQQVQAGVSPAPEPEYVPAYIVQDLLETGSHQIVAPKQYVQDLDGTMKHNGASTAQEVPVPVAETTTEPTTKLPAVPAYFRGVKFDPVPYWQKIGRWKDTTEKQFLSYRWGVRPMHLPPSQGIKLTTQ